MKKLLLTIIISFSLWGLAAHPHMGIDYKCDFHFNNNELKGAWITFAFDRFFSVDITNYYDVDKNGTFDESETDKVYNHAFINLKKYGFFISIRDDIGRTSPQEVSDFNAYLDEEETLHYRFYIDLEENDNRELFLSIYDATFFSSTKPMESKPVEIISDPPFQAKIEILENTDNPVYYDPYQPAGDTTVHKEWRPGLNTFFPEEIHLVY